MLKGKLFQMLETLSPEEWKAFEKFVNSPFFNNQENCKKLFLFLQKHIPNQNWENLQKEVLIKNVLGEHENPYPYLRVIKSQLTQLLEQFFIINQLQKTTMYQDHLLRRSFLEKRLFKYFEQLQRQIENRAEMKKGKDYFLYKYFSEFDNFFYLQIKKARNISIEILTKTINALDEVYLVHRLYLMNSSFFIQQNLQDLKQIPFVEEVTNMGNHLNFSSNQLLKTYLTAQQLVLQPNNNEWLEIIQKQIGNLSLTTPKRELNEFFTILINHYIQKSTVEKNYYHEVLTLYKVMMKYDFLTIEKYITEGNFKNIVTLGCMFNEFEWTIEFIETQKYKLPPNTQESVYHFNLGALYFYQKKFEQAQLHLIKVESFDIYYTADVRSLLLRIYYETQQYFAIEQSADSFKDFIRKQKRFKTPFKQSYTRFIRILLKLTAISQQINIKQQKEKLLIQLEKHPSIFHKKWLREKIQLL